MPVSREGARKRILTWVRAEAPPERVLPDVGGNGAAAIAGAKDIVVKLFLPQLTVGFDGVPTRGLAFETAQEIEQVAGGVETASEQMQMIGHSAVRVDGKSIFDGFFAQFAEGPRGDFRIGEGMMTIFADGSYEVPALANVMIGWEADVAMEMWHG